MPFTDHPSQNVNIFLLVSRLLLKKQYFSNTMKKEKYKEIT